MLPNLPLQAFNADLFAENWTAVAISGLVAFLAIGGMFATSRMLSSRRHSEVKLTPYECGIPPTPYSLSNINVRFYSFAILFLIFDVEAVFLFPWAFTFLSVGKAAFYEMVLFIAVLGGGLGYAWKKGVLQWK